MKQDKLKNLFNFLPKSKFKAGDGLDEGNFPFYTSSENQTKYLNEYQYAPGCLVFGTGGKASVHFTSTRFATSTDCITIKSKPEAKIEAEYVFQYFRGNMHVLEAGFKGAGLKHISKAYLSEIQIPCLDEFDDQRKTAHLLRKVEGLINKRKQHLLQLGNLLKSIFFEMFGDPVWNDKGWETAELSKLCETIIDCPHSTPVYSNEKTGYFCVRSGDIVDGYLDLSKTFHVERDVYEERIKRYTPQVGDIIYSREGGRLGNAARIIGDEEICLGQRIMLFKINDKNNADFIWALLESKAFKTKLQGLIGGGAAPRVNIKDLKKMIIIQPPRDIQVQFSCITKRIDQIKSRYQENVMDLENLYGILSQKAFKGELDLSRVPLLPQLNVEAEMEDLIPESTLEPKSSISSFMPQPDNLEMLKTLDGRREYLESCFNASLENLQEQQEFTTETFLQDVQNQLKNFKADTEQQLESADDDIKDELSTWLEEFETNILLTDYDVLKNLVFRALNKGQLNQTKDTIYINEKPQLKVILKAQKSR